MSGQELMLMAMAIMLLISGLSGMLVGTITTEPVERTTTTTPTYFLVRGGLLTLIGLVCVLLALS